MPFSILSILRAKDINTWINYCFVAFAFSIPISKAATSLFEGLIILLWILQGNWKYKFSEYIKNPIIVTLFIFLAYSILSLFWAKNLIFGIEYIAKYKHFLLIPILYLSLEKKYINTIISAFLLAMLFSEIISYGIYFEIWQYKNVPKTLPTPFISHIEYSIYLAMAAMILLNKVFFNEQRKYKIYYILFFLSITVNLFVNGGRTGQLAFIIMLVVLFMLNAQNKIKAFFTSIILATTILFVAINFSPNFQDRIAQGYSNFKTMIEEQDYTGSLSNRIGLWVVGVDQITDKLDFGSGIGNEMNHVSQYALKYNMKNDFSSYADHHNMFITYAIQLGELGLLVILSIFYFIFKLPIKDKIYRNINIMFIIAFLIWGFTGIAFHAMIPMVFFTFFVSLSNGIYFLEQPKNS